MFVVERNGAIYYLISQLVKWGASENPRRLIGIGEPSIPWPLKYLSHMFDISDRINKTKFFGTGIGAFTVSKIHAHHGMGIYKPGVHTHATYYDLAELHAIGLKPSQC